MVTNSEMMVRAGALLGLLVFGVGAAGRTYMNSIVKRSLHPKWSWRRFTEREYLQLIRTRSAPVWPLVLTAVCIPLGWVIMFASILLFKTSGHH